MGIYEVIKYIHIGCVFLSLLGFCLRSCFLLFNPEKLSQRWLKYPPHIIESLLLLSALAMLPLIGQYPFVDSWLTAKFMAMLLYIGVAGYTLRATHTFKLKLVYILLSLSIFLYIVGVAVFHDYSSWFSPVIAASSS
ncbi:hypothetical protein MNBD_GAMMA18-175 [hydrothermal vent metagenome]|uniref:Regulator SirB n=1 Tax=hydrothermal vent metagenome TaxID=652676 RepID=A0A3B0ZTQ6_9ZZZZ